LALRITRLRRTEARENAWFREKERLASRPRIAELIRLPSDMDKASPELIEDTRNEPRRFLWIALRLILRLFKHLLRRGRIIDDHDGELLRVRRNPQDRRGNHAESP